MLIALVALVVLRPTGPATSGPTPGAFATQPVASAPTSGTTAPAPPAVEARPGDGKAIPTEGAGELRGIDQRPVPADGQADLEKLYGALPPIQDYFRTAEELGGFELGERLVAVVPPQTGDRRTFATADGPREATLVVATDEAMYWVEVGLAIDPAALGAAAEKFERDYLPRVRDIFGHEWSPGVDGDSRFSILHTLGSPDVTELGYFTDENQYPKSLYVESNEQEMVYLNMSRLQVGEALYFGTLTHELQHLIQWNLDANEDVWLNEGLSQLAEKIVGLNTVSTRPHQERPDVRLDRWTDAPPTVYAHYAASYLFLQYLREQAGEAAVHELARHPANGLSAVRAVLAGYQPDRALESFAADWAVAGYLDDPAAGPAYVLLADDPGPRFLADRIRQIPAARESAPEQWTSETIDLDLTGPVVIRFAGDSVAELIPMPPGGGRVWFAPAASSSRSTLTARVDLADVKAPALAFDVWYDLERDWDYAYLSLSADEGQTWTMLPVESAVNGNYGPAFGGRSVDQPLSQAGWVRHSVSLGDYAGEAILLRFDVLTDFEGLGQGFAVANVGVAGMSGDALDWQPAGFVNTGTLLPQRWEVRLVADGERPQVMALTLDELNRGEARVELGPEGGALIIMPLTPFVEGPAAYRLEVTVAD